MNSQTVRFVGLAVFSAVFALQAVAQEETKIITLKDGSTIRGTIVRQTADTLEVESPEGLVNIPIANIRRIHNVLTPMNGQTSQPSGDTLQPADKVEDAFHVWEIIGGVTIPTGDFASTNTSAIGFASTGGCLGVQYRIDLEKGFEVGAKMVFDYYPFNRNAFAAYFPGQAQLDVGSWYLFWTLAGAGFHIPVAPNERFHVAGLVGYTVGFSPKVNVSYGSLQYSQSASSATGLGYGGEVGFYGRGLDIEVWYLAASVEYSFTMPSGSMYKVKQPTAAVQVTLGVAFL